MKIKYEFADGTVSEVEVEESIGAVIIEDRRLEDNLARKEQYMAEAERLPSLEEVRTVLAGKANAGYAAGVKRLVAAHGTGRLSEVDPAEYPALLAEAEEIWR